MIVPSLDMEPYSPFSPFPLVIQSDLFKMGRIVQAARCDPRQEVVDVSARILSIPSRVPSSNGKECDADRLVAPTQ